MFKCGTKAREQFETNVYNIYKKDQKKLKSAIQPYMSPHHIYNSFPTADCATQRAG